MDSQTLETADDVATADAPDVPQEQTETEPEDVWPDGYWLPANMPQLYGIWANDDGTTVRVLVFDIQDPEFLDMNGISPSYRLYRYPENATPVLLERGKVGMQLGALLELHAIWSSTPQDVGKTTTLQLVPAPKKSFAIATESGTARIYEKTLYLP